MLVNAVADAWSDVYHPVETFTAEAPPAPATLGKIEALGFNVTHVLRPDGDL
jgi:fatty-acyl-CoA synthase